jgi:hypothetical protein
MPLSRHTYLLEGVTRPSRPLPSPLRVGHDAPAASHVRGHARPRASRPRPGSAYRPLGAGLARALARACTHRRLRDGGRRPRRTLKRTSRPKENPAFAWFSNASDRTERSGSSSGGVIFRRFAEPRQEDALHQGRAGPSSVTAVLPSACPRAAGLRRILWALCADARLLTLTAIRGQGARRAAHARARSP